MSFALDVNILLYATDAGSDLQSRAIRFLEECAARREVFCLGWPTLMSYLRVATHPAIFTRPLSHADAMRNVSRHHFGAPRCGVHVTVTAGLIALASDVNLECLQTPPQQAQAVGGKFRLKPIR